MDIKQLLKQHAYINVPLWYDEAYALGCYALAGCHGDELAMIQSVTALSALHTKATYEYCGDGKKTPLSSAEQIAGICAAIFKEDIGKSSSGFIEPLVPYVMDNCGMGGDLIVTANVSTIAALIASSAGIPMCKHGSPANADEGRHGSSDFIELCGINPFISKEDVEKCIELYHFGYSEALDTRFKLIHRQTHDFAKLPHMNDLIGPITNPVQPHLLSRRVLGVNHLVDPKVVAEAFCILNQKGVTNMQHLLVVRGFGDVVGDPSGMDELSICSAGTKIAELRNGFVNTFEVNASTFGLKPVKASSVSPSIGKSKGEFSMDIIHGRESGPATQMVLANAALLFYLEDPQLTLRDSYNAALEVYNQDGAARKIEELQKILPSIAA